MDLWNKVAYVAYLGSIVHGDRTSNLNGFRDDIQNYLNGKGIETHMVGTQKQGSMAE